MGKKEGTWGACFTCDPDDPQPPEVPQLQLPGHTARSIIATTIHLLLQCLSWYIQRTYYRILTITDITGLHCIGLHCKHPSKTWDVRAQLVRERWIWPQWLLSNKWKRRVIRFNFLSTLDHINASLTWICFGKIFNCDLWLGFADGWTDRFWSTFPWQITAKTQRSVAFTCGIFQNRPFVIEFNQRQCNEMQYDANIQSRHQKTQRVWWDPWH